ncbi:MAG: YaeQ family protein [Kofleriaceae bacterium]
MALPATLRRFEIALADSDRNVYEQLDWRVPQHPSESERYLVARLLARSLEHADGVEFSPGGLSDDELPAIIQRDLRGDLLAWIEVGSPSPDRLHKATKLAPRVAVYGWKNLPQLVESIAERRVHRANEIVIRAIPAELINAIARTLDRNNRWEISVTGGTLYVAIDHAIFDGAIEIFSLA